MDGLFWIVLFIALFFNDKISELLVEWKNLIIAKRKRYEISGSGDGVSGD